MREHDKFNMISIYEYLLGIEEQLIFIKTLEDVMFTSARSALNDDARKTRLFLKVSQHNINKSIRHMEEWIDWIKKEIESEEERQTPKEQEG